MIAAFKQFFPDARLSVLVKPEAVSLLRHNPHVAEVLVIDKAGVHRGPAGMLRMAREIRSRKFDVLLGPHQSHRSSILAMLSGIERRVGYRGAALARFAYQDLLERDLDRPEIERLLQFLDGAFSIDTGRCSRDLEIYIEDENRTTARHLLRDLNAPRPVLVAPSSVWPTKRWTAWGFARLCLLLSRRYQTRVLLVGSKADKTVNQEVLTNLSMMVGPESRDRVIDIAGQTSLPVLYAIMEQSRLLVSNDSAPVHLGCAARIPVVAIFGPTVPALGYAPIAPGTTVAELPDLVCRPCGTHGAKRCPLEHFRCMKDLTPEMVMERVNLVAGHA